MRSGCKEGKSWEFFSRVCFQKIAFSQSFQNRSVLGPGLWSLAQIVPRVSCFMFQVSSCAAESAAAGSSARYNVQLSGTKELDSLSSVAAGGE